MAPIGKVEGRVEERTCKVLVADLEKTEDYLAELCGRLFDTQHALEAIQSHAQMEKGNLLVSGVDFRYQQAIIDIATELYRYATGEDKLQEVMEKMAEQQRKIRTAMQGGAGIEFQ